MLCSECDVFCLYLEAWSFRCSCIGSVSVSSCRCCMFVCILWQFIVSKALLISSATVIVHAAGAIWLNPFSMVLFSVFIPRLSQNCLKRLHHRLRYKFIWIWGRADRIDLKPYLCSDLKSLSASGFVILEGVLAVLALSIFPVDLILLSSFLSIDLAKEKSMSPHSLYSTPFTEVGKSQ